MNAVTRRILEMCLRVLNWVTAHPDDDAGYNALVAQLQGLVARITESGSAQQSGVVDVRASAARKLELRAAMLAVAILHLGRIGARAARERHELAQMFRFRPSSNSFVAFQNAAHVMYAEAVDHRDLLVKYGLSAAVLDQLGRQLEEFDAAMKLGQEGRTLHTAATRELRVLTKEAADLVRAMDARNRQRFQDDPQALQQWLSARTVLGIPRRAEPSAPGGDVRPAA